ncbi:MAG: cytochrome b/b6 domain-containing protein [Woeseiaceae bacterium]|nr:cytochrome b/b6 domain-containing protein [Woeseiaceae bacterium]
MDIAEFKRDVWGREVLLGVSWDLLWVILIAALLFIAIHALIKAAAKRRQSPTADGPRVLRHDALDRTFHWIMAITVVVLLVTGILPIIGVNFAWLTIHWIAGLVFTAVILFHIVRSLFRKSLQINVDQPSRPARAVRRRAETRKVLTGTEKHARRCHGADAGRYR